MQLLIRCRSGVLTRGSAREHTGVYSLPRVFCKNWTEGSQNPGGRTIYLHGTPTGEKGKKTKLLTTGPHTSCHITAKPKRENRPAVHRANNPRQACQVLRVPTPVKTARTRTYAGQTTGKPHNLSAGTARSACPSGGFCCIKGLH